MKYMDLKNAPIVIPYILISTCKLVYALRGGIYMQNNYFEFIKDELEQGRTICEATVVEVEGKTPRDVGTSMVIKSDGSTLGTIGGGNLEYTIIKKASKYIKDEKCGIEEVVACKDNEENNEINTRIKVFLKVHLPVEKLVIFGAGHVGTALYNYAIDTNFLVTIADGREGFLTEEKYPKATQLITGGINEQINEELINSNTYVIIASSSHKSDEELLKKVLGFPCKYIGMIGSRKKVDTIFENLQGEGIKKSELDKVYSPVGLKIGGRSPEEIALGIMAEIISVKNNMGGKLRHMK